MKNIKIQGSVFLLIIVIVGGFLLLKNAPSPSTAPTSTVYSVMDNPPTPTPTPIPSPEPVPPPSPEPTPLPPPLPPTPPPPLPLPPPPLPTPTPVPPPITPPSTSGIVIGDIVAVTGDKVNIRKSASSSSLRIGTQVKYMLGTVATGPTSGSGYIWYKVDFMNGVDGWIISNYLKETTLIKVGDTVYTTESLNVRSSPATTAKRLGTQGRSARGVVTEGPVSGNGYIWWKINFASGADGWVINKLGK